MKSGVRGPDTLSEAIAHLHSQKAMIQTFHWKITCVNLTLSCCRSLLRLGANERVPRCSIPSHVCHKLRHFVLDQCYHANHELRPLPRQRPRKRAHLLPILPPLTLQATTVSAQPTTCSLQLRLHLHRRRRRRPRRLEQSPRPVQLRSSHIFRPAKPITAPPNPRLRQ